MTRLETEDDLLRRSDAELEVDAALHETLALAHMTQNTEKFPLSITSPLLEACRVIDMMGITDKNAIRMIITEALKPSTDHIP